MGSARARARGEDAFAIYPQNGDSDFRNNAGEPIVDPFHPDQAWRRDVPEVNAEKFAEWLADLERRGKPLLPYARLLNARFLSKQGNHAEQAEIVDFCMMNQYKRLLPLVVVHHSSGSAQNGKGGARETIDQILARMEREYQEMPGPEVNF